MKRSFTYALVTIVLFSTLVLSCKKDDPAAPSIIGSWKYSGSATTDCDDATNNGTETCTGDASACGKIVITSAGYTYTPPTGGGAAETGTYVITGSTLTNTPTGGGSANVVTFTVTATTMTFTSVDDSSGCTSTTTFTRM